MLVLTRKTGERFWIGDEVEVTVQSVKGDSVRVAISAPKEISILRAELKEARQVNRESAMPTMTAVEALKRNLRGDQDG